MNGNNENIRDIFIAYAFDDDSDFDLWFSDSSSEPEFEIPHHREKRVRIQNFLDIVSEYSEEEFRRHFRLRRDTANSCIADLELSNTLSSHSFGRQKVSARQAFLMVVWYLAHQETYRQISDRFNCTESTAWRIIRIVIEYLVVKSASVIKWPNEEEAAKIDEEFEHRQGLKGVLGAIDGSHISINRKSLHQNAYCNRKGTHSIILQGVVDSKKRFIDVFTGEPGSLHDSRVLKKSTLYHKLGDGILQIHNRYLVGDSAYPTYMPWLVTPFKDNGNLTNQQRLYNYKHACTRVVIENAFGLLKGRFRRLRHFDNNDISFVVKCVIAACTLHNICLDHGEREEDIELYYDDDI